MRPVQVDQLPRQLVGLYHSISYDEYVNAGWYAADDGHEMGRYSARVYERASTEVSKLADKRLVAQEMDSLDRLACNWRHKGLFPFPYETGDELHFHNRAQLGTLRPYLDSVIADVMLSLERQRDVVLSAVKEATYPFNKGKGAPFFIPGNSIDGGYALAALAENARSVDELQEMTARCGAKIGCVITLYIRIQAAKKTRAVYTTDASGAPIKTNGEALLAKVRKVQAVPFVFNYPLAELGTALLTACRAPTLGILPTVEAAVAFSEGAKQEELVAEDISNFDDSVGYEVWQYVIERCALRVIRWLLKSDMIGRRQASLMSDILTKIGETPIIVPPTRRTHGAELLSRSGGIISGIRLTSIVGSIINAARIRFNMAEYTRKQRRGASLVFSDDTLVRLPASEAAMYVAGLEDSSARTGFVTKLADDASFLMRRMPAGYAYLGRMCMSTLQKESTREPRSLPVAALGIAARAANLAGHPLAALYQTMLREGDFGPRYRAAYNLSRACSVEDLGRMAVADVGATPSGGSKATSIEEIVDYLFEAMGVSYDDPRDVGALRNIPSALKEQVIRSNPKVVDVKRAISDVYGTGRDFSLSKVKEHLAPWR